MLLAFIAAIIFIVWSYVLFIREWLVQQWPDRFTAWHSMEDWLWLNSRQILLARMYWILGVIIGIHESLAASGFDITPFLLQFQDYIPEKLRPMVVPMIVPAFLVGTGLMMGWLRRITTEPLDMQANAGLQSADSNLLTNRNVGNK